ncbi:predicted protein [Nematostella vectensis]|uniref:G-protein coupled receptors family 1 profile domain-containing protein n=1 Tax=Nematostella vectensis TaxID=45351 RepID=A7SB82_NEMVE|nr:trace amine-associated receptor 13c [Nematostella vectensis]EDO39039.1 predicted protein [Nematostella vectensis]|eukprot:XP_001631102.1 predicted protein [Nematostella vectensis]
MSQPNLTTRLNQSTVICGGDPTLYSTEAWYWILRGLIAFITIFGNGLVIYLVSFRKPLRDQPSPNWFVMSLALADFCVGAFNFPTMFVYAFTFNCFSQPSSWTWPILGFCMNVFLDASITNLTLLTLDRYLAVVHPFTYESFMTSSRAAGMIVSAWGITVILEIPYLVLDIQRAGDEAYTIHLWLYMVIFTFLPCVFMLYAYTRILIVARRHRKEISARLKRMASFSESTDVALAQRGNKNGAMYTVGIIVGIFLLCNSFVQYRLSCFLSPSCSMSAAESYLFLLLRYANSAPNFIVYAFMKSDFRREIYALYKKKGRLAAVRRYAK